MNCDVVVIGGGPSGLMASLFAARKGASVVLLEKLQSPGRRILASGGGHCNITNRTGVSSFSAAFGKRKSFVKHALSALTSVDLCSFFENAGVKTESPDGFHVFPASQKVRDVLDALVNECKGDGVDVQIGSRSIEVRKSCDLWHVQTEEGEYTCRSVIIAAGGKSYPALGGGDSGYELARALKHTIITPVPGLSSVRLKNSLHTMCVGLSLPSAELILKVQDLKDRRSKGIVLFTHTGISGPAVLDISASVARASSENRDFTLMLVPCSYVNEQEWDDRFINWQQSQGSKTLKALLTSCFPSRFAKAVVAMSGLEEKARVSDLKKDNRRKLVSLLGKGIPLKVDRVEGFDKAMVTSGGVDCSEVNPRTMESRICQGLYFCGEVLDVDGPCGGYNLQWAFSSGAAAGKSAYQA